MFSIALILTVYSSYLPGIKYLLLTQLGVTSIGDVTRIDSPTISYEQVLAFSEGELSEDDMRELFRRAGPGERQFYLTIEFKPHTNSLNEILKVPLQLDRLYQVTDGLPIEITFLRSNPSIAYPTEWLGDYRFDMKVLLVASAILAFVLWTLIKTVRQLREFQNKMKRY